MLKKLFRGLYSKMLHDHLNQGLANYSLQVGVERDFPYKIRLTELHNSNKAVLV